MLSINVACISICMYVYMGSVVIICKHIYVCMDMVRACASLCVCLVAGYVYIMYYVSIYVYLYMYVGVHICVGLLGSVFSVYL